MDNNLKNNESTMIEVLKDMIKNQRKTISKIVKMFVITIICYTCVLIALIWAFFWYESQFEFSDETVTTITQDVSGSDSEINNVSGDMYKDDAIHNE